jgi:hypothetical protein
MHATIYGINSLAFDRADAHCIAYVCSITPRPAAAIKRPPRGIVSAYPYVPVATGKGAADRGSIQ